MPIRSFRMVSSSVTKGLFLVVEPWWVAFLIHTNNRNFIHTYSDILAGMCLQIDLHGLVWFFSFLVLLFGFYAHVQKKN